MQTKEQSFSHIKRKKELPTEYRSLLRDWMSENNIDIQGKNYSEIKLVVLQFRQEIGKIISSKHENRPLVFNKLSLEDFYSVRKELGMPKWIPLREVVAFVKTVLDTSNATIQEKYFEYASSGISQDDMRNLLMIENRVKPSRIDTDIYNQSPDEFRSIVEVISNAIDAFSQLQIGRFGVGFYQIFSHLESEADSVVVTTGNKKSGFSKISFCLLNNEVCLNIEKSDLVDQESGTIVELNKRNYPAEEAIKIVKNNLEYNDRARIYCNGNLVNTYTSFENKNPNTSVPEVSIIINDSGFKVIDNGRGMTPDVIFQKLLVPKQSNKPSIKTLKNLEIKADYKYNEISNNSTTETIICVGGNTVEKFTINGRINCSDKLVLYFPAFTALGEEREEIGVDETSIVYMKKVIDDIIDKGNTGALNALCPVVTALDKKSRDPRKENNLVLYLQNKFRSTITDKHQVFLPNFADFTNLEVANSVYLDPLIKTTNFNTVADLKKLSSTGSGLLIYTAPFKTDAETKVIRWKNQLIIDEQLYLKFAKEPTLLNLYLSSYALATGISVKSVVPDADSAAVNLIESQHYENIESFISRHWQLLGFANQDSAIYTYNKLDQKQLESLQIVFDLIVNKFPANLSVYFIDAVFYGDLAILSKENLSAFASLALSRELIEILANLDIKPIMSEEAPIKHLKGIASASDREYIDTQFSAENYDDPRSYSRERLRASSGCDNDFDELTYNDKRTIIYRGGELYPIPRSYKADHKEYFISETNKLTCFDTQTKAFTELNYDFGSYFLQPTRLSCKRFNFMGLRNLALFDDYYTIHSNDRDKNHSKYNSIEYKSISKEIFGDNIGQIAFPYLLQKYYCQLIDLDTGQPFNPRPDLGKLIAVNCQSTEHKHNALIYQDSQNPEFFWAYYDDGVIENFKFNFDIDAAVPNRWLEENPRARRMLFNTEYLANKNCVKISNPSGQVIFEQKLKESPPNNRNADRRESYRANIQSIPYKNQEFTLIKIVEPTDQESQIDIDFRHHTPNGIKEMLSWDKGAQYGCYLNYNALLGPNNKVIFKGNGHELVTDSKITESGEILFLVTEYSQLYNRYTSDNYSEEKYPPAIKKHYVINANGRKLDDSHLKHFQINDFVWLDLEKDKYIFVNDKDKYIYVNDKNHISLQHGKNWKLQFSTTKYNVLKADPKSHKLASYTFVRENNLLAGEEHKAFCINIINNNGKAVLDRLKSVQYNEAKKWWECKSLDWKLINGIQYNKMTYLDTDGKVLQELYITDRDDSPIRIPGKDKINWNRLIDTENSHLTKAKTESVAKALEENTVENDQNLRRFLNRVFKYNYLSDSCFSAILKVLLEVDDIEKFILQDYLIAETEVRLKKYDDNIKTWFYKIWMKMANKDWDQKTQTSFLNKLVKVFDDKLSNFTQEECDEIYQTMDTARPYENKYVVNGWNIIKYQTPVPATLIPEKIRSIISYLCSQEQDLQAHILPEIEFPDQETFKFRLTQLVQSKRLDEVAIDKITDSEDLQNFILKKTADRSQEHIAVEIIHPIYHQSLNEPYLFIREIVQNCYDARITALANDEDFRSDVLINIFSRKSNEITFRIEDFAGMSFSQFINYYLIAGETSKINIEEAIGFFGQGVFTLFRDAKEVVIQTGVADGKINKFKITPVYDQHNEIVDLDVVHFQEEGDFKGTIIEKTVETNHPEVEGAYLKNAVSTYTGLVDSQIIQVSLNGMEVNSNSNKIASIDVPELGKISIDSAPNNVVTQRGLYIKYLDSDYDTGIKDVEDLLHRRGYVLDIPKKIPLIRSRNEIARKQKYLEILKAYLPALKVQAYLEFFRLDLRRSHVIQLDDLPYDYFYWTYQNNAKILEDAKNMIEGKPVSNIDMYTEKGTLISLLVLLPVLEINNRLWSILELKEAALKDQPPLDIPENYEKIPRILRDKLLEGKKIHESRQQSSFESRETKVSDFSLDNWSNQPEIVKKMIENNLSLYQKFEEFINKLNKRIGKDSLGTTFYYEPGSKAHATQGFGHIGWNLEYWRPNKLRWVNFERLDNQGLKEILDTWSHEMGHIKERSGEFTHNPNFYRKQMEALYELMTAI